VHGHATQVLYICGYLIHECPTSTLYLHIMHDCMHAPRCASPCSRALWPWTWCHPVPGRISLRQAGRYCEWHAWLSQAAVTRPRIHVPHSLTLAWAAPLPLQQSQPQHLQLSQAHQCTGACSPALAVSGPMNLPGSTSTCWSAHHYAQSVHGLPRDIAST
jgi:hypothetical protein